MLFKSRPAGPAVVLSPRRWAAALVILAASVTARADVDAGGAAAIDPAERRAVQAMQSFYEKAKDCRAQFTQTYLNQTFHKALTSTGTLRFKKPGLLRFDYQTPEPKLFVVRNERLTSYVPAAQQAMVGGFKADRLSASVTFLFGKGELSTEFTIRRANRADLAPGVTLELTPKAEDPRFTRIYFVLDPRSFAVKESVVVDPSGNENRFDFTNLETGVGLSEKDFEVELPPGTQVVKVGD